jgi:hypothetical protein
MQQGWRAARVYFLPFSLSPRLREIPAPEQPLTGRSASNSTVARRRPPASLPASPFIVVLLDWRDARPRAAHRSAVLDNTDDKTRSKHADGTGEHQKRCKTQSEQHDEQTTEEQKPEPEIDDLDHPGPTAHRLTLAAAFPQRSRSADGTSSARHARRRDRSRTA